jgi:hypothetical protein
MASVLCLVVAIVVGIIIIIIVVVVVKTNLFEIGFVNASFLAVVFSYVNSGGVVLVVVVIMDILVVWCR